MTNCNAQDKNEFLYNKEFSAVVGNIYEETPGPDLCSGQEIYLILKFSKKNVSIVQKAISSCGEENVEHEFHYKWKLLKNKQIKVYGNPKEIKYSYLENLMLEIRNKEIYGSIVYPSNKKIEYIFLNNN